MAGDPRGGWPPADTGIVLPEYSTPRYRDLLPPRLGGRRQVGLVGPENDRHRDQSSHSRAGKLCRPMHSALITATDGATEHFIPNAEDSRSAKFAVPSVRHRSVATPPR